MADTRQNTFLFVISDEQKTMPKSNISEADTLLRFDFLNKGQGPVPLPVLFGLEL